MKPWSVREVPWCGRLWWSTHCFLTWHMPLLEKMVQCMPMRGENLAEVQHLVPSARCVPGRGKKTWKENKWCEKHKNELSETSWSGLVSPKAQRQELLLARMCHTSAWEGSDPRREGTQWVRGKLQSQTSHLCGTVWEYLLHRKIQIANLWVNTKLTYGI